MGDYLMSLIKANNITNVTGGIPTVKSQQLIPTAWVNFNGSGTVAIRDSENVSSITDLTTGQFVANFTTAMANANYAVSCSCGDLTWGSKMIVSTQSTTNTKVYTFTGNALTNNYGDPDIVCITVMGGQS